MWVTLIRELRELKGIGDFWISIHLKKVLSFQKDIQWRGIAPLRITSPVSVLCNTQGK